MGTYDLPASQTILRSTEGASEAINMAYIGQYYKARPHAAVKMDIFLRI